MTFIKQALPYLIVLAVIILGLYLKSSTFKGKQGERRASRRLKHLTERGARIVDDVILINPVDLYVMLGNALDNAIECVLPYEEEEKKVISLNIRRDKGFDFIELANYCESKITFVDGIPVTSKEDKSSHGFGVISLKLLAEKYDGTFYCGLEDKIFTILIGIPSNGQ